MKTGDEVYIKGDGEGAVRRIVDACKPNFNVVAGFCAVFMDNELHQLKPNRIWLKKSFKQTL